jgi:hypothetical protein
MNFEVAANLATNLAAETGRLLTPITKPPTKVGGIPI